MVERVLNFPTIYQDGKVAGYGGNQEWFAEDMKRKAGCGCTSGANLAAYYALNHSGMENVYKGNLSQFDLTEYVSAMNEMYHYMKPGLIGYPYVKKFGRQFVRFCRERGIEAEAIFCTKFEEAETAFHFVKDSIDSDNPVALLILFHRAHALREDNWHWVTITGYIEDENSTDHSEVILSNCGERQIVKAHQLFEVHRKNTIRMVRFQIL